jgi:hypothetical protein
MFHRLTKAIQTQAPIDETADMVEDLIPEDELRRMVAMPNETVVDEIVRQAGGRHPILASPEGRVYLGLLLTELKRTDEGGEAQVGVMG